MLFYLILALLFVVMSIMCLGQWVKRRQAEQSITFLQQENVELRQDCQRIWADATDVVDVAYFERDNAVANLSMVLTMDPVPFNHVAVELGLNGVVYQFHSLNEEEIECSEEQSSLQSVPEPDLPSEQSAAFLSDSAPPTISTALPSGR